MDGNISGEESGSIDWSSDDELETQNLPPSSSSMVIPGGEASVASGEASSSAGPSNSKLINQFTGMGFSQKMVLKAIEQDGKGNTDSILEYLLTYSALEDDPQELENCSQAEPQVESDDHSSDYDGRLSDDFSDSDSCHENEENISSLSEKDKKLLFLADMGFTVEEASAAMDRCGPDCSVLELTEFISAARISRAADADLGELSDEEKPRRKHPYNNERKKRKLLDYRSWERKKQKDYEKKVRTEDHEPLRLPNPMIGFGVPSELCPQISRKLPTAAIGPPYFYYENVALAPKGVWSTISRFLYDVEPEFVDSKYFCAAARKRGYLHNLPIQNRFPLLPLPPMTISDALPLTRKWWPSWDTRTKLNCLQTCTGSARLTDRIRKALEEEDGVPRMSVQKYVLDECRKWNLVWVGRNKVAPLEPDEVEMLLGFPRNHTRGGGISRTDRFKSLGNSFQVDTVAYHFSVLKDMFPGGITLLSLFSGIGGAEVALHRLGIPLKNVVSVEISETNRNIIKSWWEQTNQRGTLIEIEDVQQLNGDRLEQLIHSFGGFDLIVGGSPCNNLAGSNRVSRDGLEGKESALFFDYFRILDQVKSIMGRN